MRFLRLVVVASLALLTGCGSARPVRSIGSSGGQRAQRGDTYRWTFDEPGSGPFVSTLPLQGPRRLFLDVLGRWAVEADSSALSLPNVYRQGATFGPRDVPRVFVSSLVFADLHARVSCRAEAGLLARGCGLVMRAQDEHDYDVALVDSLEGRVRLVRVQGGQETTLGEATMPPASAEWRTLEVDAHLRVITVSVDGVRVLDAREDVFHDGRVGLLTPKDAVTAFDDFEVTAE